MAADGVVELTKGHGGALQPLPGIFPGPLRRILLWLPGQKGPHLPQTPLGHQEEQHRRGKHLIEYGQPHSAVPGPEHRHRVREHIGHRRTQPSLPPKGARHHP